MPLPRDTWDRGPHIFATTHWTVVLAAAKEGSGESSEALEELCRGYWYPLYAYVRRRGHDPDLAQDLTQEFFAQLLSGKALGQVHPRKGRFRSFLLASMNHFLANDWHRRQTLKRGGGLHFLSLDGMRPEARYQAEPASYLSPEKLFERRWTLALLDRAVGRLEQEWSEAGKAELFNELKAFLADARGTVPYQEVAHRTGMTETALRQAVRRLRGRYRELMCAEIGQTVSGASELEDEIKHLFDVFGE